MKFAARLLVTGLVVAVTFWTVAVIAYELAYSPQERLHYFHK